ncbi:autotransporter domain-containing protein [Mesorhizobium opportunistum]|uniref:Outer membrane autotransporter barrel domain protein n=1 Tax=Mesorhizobium opportunistum (strain LMG 24607 / HAMBI 3007 / WSM2075) TaxID=536019 RepID=F7Y092_MESOW|nr:autotransporter domain-containing protein [Mesorhizobium opportunistum]AEH90458.1 outer membrane autotransporter barrel domain protein [Mesorhizobium opportunistum WSM2075]
MDTRTPSTSPRGVTSLYTESLGGPLRKALLASTALALALTLPATGPARAQDATWQVNPGSDDFFDANNWTPGSVPTGTATFGASNTTTLTLGSSGSFDGWTLDAGASNYTFSLTAGQVFTGTGITINGGSATISNYSTLNFSGASTAGNAAITNNYDLRFYDTSTAGSATITNNNFLHFNDTSTAGSATITNNNYLSFSSSSTSGNATITNNSILEFYDTSTAGNATIANNVILDFLGTSTAGDATITNNSNLSFIDASTAGNAAITNIGGMNFYGTSTAGNATITNNNQLRFYGSSTAGGATIINNGVLDFLGTSTAGDATITNNTNLSFIDASTAGSATIINSTNLSFNDASTAGSATIANYGLLSFYNTSTAGNAAITNTGTLSFYDTSTAGAATITSNNFLHFNDTSTAGSATITNNGYGYLSFLSSSTAGNATITNSDTLEFYDTSTAGAATITNNNNLTFYGTSTAGSATITNNSILHFNDTSTAGSATITNNSILEFYGTRTAGDATITNNSILEFYDTSTAGAATITNSSGLYFVHTSTAGNATITNDSFLGFYHTSTAGSAALINDAGATVDFSNSTGPNGDGRLTAGSIEGAGNYILGANELTVGSNNLSTEVVGVISGSGSLVKTGTGTLTFSGANTYTGGTTIAGGTLQFGNGISGGITNLAGSINVTGGTLAIQAPTTLNVAQNVTFGDNTALSIAAGASSPGLTSDSITIGNGVTFNISGITDASQLDMVLIDTASGISGDFASINVGGFGGTVDYLTVSTRKSSDNLQYLASYGLTWNAGNNLANGTFTLTNATDSFTVGTVLADQAANLATGWSGASLTKAGAGTLTLAGTNTYTGGTTISGGALSVSGDANLGAATGGLTFAGGTLSTTASFDTARAVSLTQAGRFDVADGTELGLMGVVSGSGDLIKQGSGTLRLDNGANAYGNAFVAAGTLIGNAASISGNIGNAGTLVFDQAGNANFSGDIAALNGTSGAMIKRGTGVLTLAGLSSLDWAIEAGGLASSAERFGGDAAIASGASFTFDQSANATYAGVLSGDGGFNKTGTALLNLTGDSSGFTGTTTIAGGALAVNGSLGGMLDVLSAGRLQGTGTVGDTTVSGTVAPGNSIGTINIAGNITFNTGSIYEVEVDAGGQSDRIIATGAAAINGGTVTVLAGAGSYAPQTQYTIVTASGGRTGTFTGATSDLAFLDPSLSYDANNVYLTMARNNIDFAGVGPTANQRATGGGVESLGWGNPLYGAVVNLSAPQARYAFDQLSGEIHGSARTALIEDSRFIRNAVNDRIRAAFDAAGASGTVSTYDGGKPVTVKANTDRFAVWGQGFGSWGHASSDGNAAHLNRKTGGFFFGADAPVFDTWRFGAVAGYSQTSFDVKDRHSSGSSDNYYVGLYGGTAWGDVAFRTGAAYTWHDVSTSRSVTFPGFGDGPKGDYNAATAQMFGEFAYGFRAGGARFEPFANLAYVNLHTDGFTEQGGAAALTGASANTDSTFATLGLRASTTFAIGGTTLTAKGMAGWRHAFGDMAPTSTMRFAGGGNAFNIGGIPIARDAAVIEAGLDYAITPNATLGVSYGGQFGSGISDQSARFNFNVKF